MISTFKRTLLVQAAVAAMVLPTAVAAQDAEAEEGGIADIVVTARKKTETLQETPVAVSVVGAQQIEELGLNSIDDFAKNSTGISFSQAFGRTTDRPVIRGQSNVLAGVQAGVETGAAYFVDGVYYQGDIQGFDPSAIERVEIVKGPQSALYGRNTYAGAINYITKDPSKDMTASGRVRIAEHSEREASLSLSGPLIENILSFRAGARLFEYGGEYTNQLTGKKVGQEKTRSAYLMLQLDAHEDVKLRVRGSWQKDDDGPLALFLQGAEFNNCKPGFRSPLYRNANTAFLTGVQIAASNNSNQFYCGVIKPQPNNIQLNTDPILLPGTLGTRDGTAYDGITNSQFLATSVLDWDIGGSGWVLSTHAGYRNNKNLFGTDSDHSNAFVYFGPAPAANTDPEPAFANTNRDDQSDASYEVRLSTPQDKPIRAMIGGYLFNQKFTTVDITFRSGSVGEPALATNTSQYATIKNKALFGMVEWDLTDALNIAAEIRYAEETKTLLDRATGVTAASIFCAGQPKRALAFFGPSFSASCRGAGTFTGTDPRVVVNYTTPGGALIYGVFATGRKPGGFNGTAGVTAETQYPGNQFVNYLPEKSKGGELGVKFDALDRRLRINATAFMNDLTDVQLTASIPNPAGTGALTSIVVNSGNAETKGFELEATAAPTDNLLVSFGLSYVDAKFTKGCDADEFILNSGGLRVNFDTRNPTPAGLALCDISGRTLPLGSPWMANGTVAWDKDIGGGLTLVANSNFSYEASKYVQVDNLAETGKAFLLNARIGIRSDKFSLMLFGRNLTKEDSIPLATRWFDLRYPTTRNLPAASTVTFDGRTAIVESGSPRGFFAPLRKGRTFGVEGTFNF